MLKNLIVAVIAFCILAVGGICQAEEQYTEEINLEVGTAWQLQVPKVLYQADNHDVCELLENDDKTYSILMTKPGDVVITAYIFEDKQIYQAKYLIHIIGDTGTTMPVSQETPEYDKQFMADEVLRLVNIERAKVGARSLRLSSDLQYAASIRAKELTQVFSHDRPDGSSCFTAVGDVGYSTLGENIAAGSATPEAVVRQWMNSPGHKANILNSAFRELGVGYCYDSNGVGGYKHYWVQIFKG